MNEQQLYELLLTPIRQGALIQIDHKIIYSGKRYASSDFDPDMSDIAVLFYETIYSDILKAESVLGENRKLKNKMFAGDTMNSFNTTANKVPEAGRSRKQRTDSSLWPEYLQTYYDSYHCLANFWLLPMDLGRWNEEGGTLNRYKHHRDYMDYYLKEIQSRYQSGKSFEKYEEYFTGCFAGWEDFCEKHFLVGSYVDEETYTVKEANKDPETFIRYAMEMMRKRAKCIAESEYADELTELFSR